MTDISAYQSQYNTPIVLSVPELTPKLGAYQLIKRIAQHYDVPIGNLMGEGRERGSADMVLKRHVAFFAVYKILRNGYAQTSRAFSKDHTTILYGIGRVERMCARDPAFKAGVWELIDKLREGYNARDRMPIL